MVRPEFQPWVERFLRAGLLNAYRVYPSHPAGDRGDGDADAGSTSTDRYPAPDCDPAEVAPELYAWGGDTGSPLPPAPTDLAGSETHVDKFVCETTRND